MTWPVGGRALELATTPLRRAPTRAPRRGGWAGSTPPPRTRSSHTGRGGSSPPSLRGGAPGQVLEGSLCNADGTSWWPWGRATRARPRVGPPPGHAKTDVGPGARTLPPSKNVCWWGGGGSQQGCAGARHSHARACAPPPPRRRRRVLVSTRTPARLWSEPRQPTPRPPIRPSLLPSHHTPTPRTPYLGVCARLSRAFAALVLPVPRTPVIATSFA